MSKILERIDRGAIDRFTDMLYEAWRNRRRVWVFGNGGSASTASHYVCDLLKNTAAEGRPRLQVFCLGDNIATMTALGNDISYDDVFRFPLSAYAQNGDVAVALTGSGNSPNVLRAVEWARENGLKVVALTGFSGGKLKEMADLHINIPSDNYGVIEDLHLSINHIVSQTLKGRMASAAAEVA
jgi:D-sedoheptulose 7-phosphate isomerase